MSAKTLTKPAARAPTRSDVAKRGVGGRMVAGPAYDDMTEEQLYALLDQRLGDLERRVVAGRASTDQLLKRLG